ncbi:hypothetical protein GCM10011573_03280 [Enterococcus wangshanyuanii]|uniref:Uncharacterized protein n=1 Tax=Enterococcus wangshanyuanii TaxID=2005703 RepID=A0ABQ1NHW5_9ENTE|nr:hypothetical protein GCM10011573_03280 [Enterococcus wangshanyuanii]
MKKFGEKSENKVEINKKCVYAIHSKGGENMFGMVEYFQRFPFDLIVVILENLDLLSLANN